MEVASSTFYGFSRATSSVNWRGGALSADGKIHRLSSGRAGTNSYGAAEASVGYAQRWDALTLRGSLGGFTTGRSLPIGELFLDWKLGGGFTPYVGAYRLALAKDVPLPADLSGLARDVVVFGFRVRNDLDYRLEVRSFGGLTQSTRHSLDVRVPIYDGVVIEPRSGRLSLAFQGETERFGAATPYIYSPRMATALRGGLNFASHYTENLSGSLQVDYGQVFESQQAVPSGNQLTLGAGASLLGLGAEMGYLITKELLAGFRFRVDRTSGDQGSTTYGSTVFGVGLTWKFRGGR